MRLALIATMVLGLPAAALGADAAQNQAVQRHLQCVADSVVKVDNGKMTPEQLAQAIVPLCHGAHSAAMVATGGDVANSEVELAHTWAAVLVAQDRLRGRAR